MSEVANYYDANVIPSNTAFYTSISTANFADKVKLNNAIADSVAIIDHLDTWFVLRDIVIQEVELTDDDADATPDNSPTVSNVLMTVLVADDGTAYRVFSGGVFRDLQRILNLLGEPSTWDMPVAVKVVESRSGKNRYYNLRADLAENVIDQ